MTAKQKPFNDEVKALLEERRTIALHDLAMQKVAEVLAATSLEALPINLQISPEEVENRLKQYEAIIGDLEALIILTTYWGEGEHHLTLQKTLARLAEIGPVEQTNGLELRLRWYPFSRIAYAGGLAAIAAERYENLAALLMSWCGIDDLRQKFICVARLRKAILGLDGPIGTLPQFTRNYTPASNYMFSSLQPTLDKLLVIGKQYETFFDLFELLVALIYSDLEQYQGAFYGRFVWKYKHLDPDASNNPLVMLRKEAEQCADNWPIFQAGLFGGSFDRFAHAHASVRRQIELTNWR